jgi:hypothetical protein
MLGRDFRGEKYRYSFGRHEKDDELKGHGNHISFGNYGYDPRIGRRFALDPVVKHNMSGYTTFSNNPIIFIDPDGTTDFYNSKGNWIGTDGISNGEKKMVLTQTTAKEIKRATKKGQNIAMNTKSYYDIIDIQSVEEIEAMDAVFTRGRKSGYEEGFVSGAPPVKGNKKIISVLPSYSAIETDVAPGEEDIKKQGGIVDYDVHLHQPMIQFTPKKDFDISSPYPGKDDRTNTELEYEKTGVIRNNIILAYSLPTDVKNFPVWDVSAATANQGNWIPVSLTYSKTISFYNGKSKGDFANFDYDKYKKAVEKARNHNPKNTEPKECKP